MVLHFEQMQNRNTLTSGLRLQTSTCPLIFQINVFIWNIRGHVAVSHVAVSCVCVQLCVCVAVWLCA